MPQCTKSVVKQDSETGSCGLVKGDFHFQRFRGWGLIGRRNCRTKAGVSESSNAWLTTGSSLVAPAVEGAAEFMAAGFNEFAAGRSLIFLSTRHLAIASQIILVAKVSESLARNG
jgi:hypothetical protein